MTFFCKCLPSLLSYEKHRCHTRDKVNIYQFTTSFCSPDHMYNQGSQRSINSSISLMLLHTEKLLLFSNNPVFCFRSYCQMTVTILKSLIRNCICFEITCLEYRTCAIKTRGLYIFYPTFISKQSQMPTSQSLHLRLLECKIIMSSRSTNAM